MPDWWSEVYITSKGGFSSKNPTDKIATTEKGSQKSFETSCSSECTKSPRHWFAVTQPQWLKVRWVRELNSAIGTIMQISNTEPRCSLNPTAVFCCCRSRQKEVSLRVSRAEHLSTRYTAHTRQSSGEQFGLQATGFLCLLKYFLSMKIQKHILLCASSFPTVLNPEGEEHPFFTSAEKASFEGASLKEKEEGLSSARLLQAALSSQCGSNWDLKVKSKFCSVVWKVCSSEIL